LFSRPWPGNERVFSLASHLRVSSERVVKNTLSPAFAAFSFPWVFGRMTCMAESNLMKVDRNRLHVSRLSEPVSDKDYWLSRTPSERLEALQMLRELNFGIDKANAGLQGVLEIAWRA
jgi:hypothetical protein